MLILRGWDLGVGDELGNRFGRHRRMHQHDVGVAADSCDRRDVADEIEIELVVERRVDRVRCGDIQERIAIRGRTHDRLGGNVAPRARSVLDDKWLCEPLRQPLSHQAGRDVGPPGGRERHDQTHRPRWIGLRESEARHRRQRGGARGQMQKLSAGKFHSEPPSRFTSLDHQKQHYSISSSARPDSGSGTVMPSVLAVLRLMYSSTFVACCTGRSAGFSPLRTRPV